MFEDKRKVAATLYYADHHVRGMWLTDCLQVALFDEDSEEYYISLLDGLFFNGFEDKCYAYEPVVTSPTVILVFKLLMIKSD